MSLNVGINLQQQQSDADWPDTEKWPTYIVLAFGEVFYILKYKQICI